MYASVQEAPASVDAAASNSDALASNREGYGEGVLPIFEIEVICGRVCDLFV